MAEEFIMGSGGVPVGSYRATFVGTEPFTENEDKYGPALAVKFRVNGGEFDGQEASRICGKKMSPRSALTKMATALKGSQIAPGERFSFEPLVGVTGMVLVEGTDSGSTRVATFIRDQQPPPSQPQQAPPPQPQAQPQAPWDYPPQAPPPQAAPAPPIGQPVQQQAPQTQPTQQPTQAPWESTQSQAKEVF